MKIKLKGEWESKRIWLNGKELLPDRSLMIVNHSPDGFSYGYAGSGPSQLAFALCLEIYDNPAGYQIFKRKFIATLPQSNFDLTLTIPENTKELINA